MENPWLAWYPGEYISKTRRLSMAQHGAYMLLLWEYYISGPLLANATDLLNVCCAKSEEDQVDVAYVLEKFFVLKDGFYYNERADEEIKKRESIREQRKLVGRKGGLAKARVLLEQTPSKKLDNHNHNHNKSKAKAQSAFVMPDWLPKEAWNHYEEMRLRIRKPMTDQARIWAVAELERLRTRGQDPRLVLEQSVFNSWQGLFELRGRMLENNKPSPAPYQNRSKIVQDELAKRKAQGL